MKVGGPGGPDFEALSKTAGADMKTHADTAKLAAFSKFDLTNEVVSRLSKMPSKTPEVDKLINDLTRITHGIGNACW
jgi:hypothetical protein